MKKETSKKDGMSTGKVVAIGASVVALATASYYLFGPNGKSNRKELKGWMIKMKGEIVDKLEDAQDVTEDVYNKIVDTVASAYLKGGKAGAEEVSSFVNTLKKQWKSIAKSTTPKKKSAPSKKKAAKKSASKKSVSKSSKR